MWSKFEKYSIEKQASKKVKGGKDIVIMDADVL